MEKLYPTALDILTELKSPLKSSVQVSVTEVGKDKPNHKSKPVTPVPQLDENITLLDFRSSSAFEQKALPGAVNIPLSTLSKDELSPFEDSAILERQWLEIDELFAKKEASTNGQPKSKEMNGTAANGNTRRSSWVNWVPGFGASNKSTAVGQQQRETVIGDIFENSKSRRVVCVDYGGDTARVATSVLRAKGIEAWSLGGGMRKWDEESEKAKTAA